MKIRYIIDGWIYWDKNNGNSYYLTRVTHTNTGRSVIFDQYPGNMRSVIHDMEHKRVGSYFYDFPVHESPIEDISYRDWQRKLSSTQYAPVDVYHRSKRGKVTNITDKIIRSLAKTS